MSFVNVWHHLAGSAWMPGVLLAAQRAHDSGAAPRGVAVLIDATIAGQRTGPLSIRGDSARAAS